MCEGSQFFKKNKQKKVPIRLTANCATIHFRYPAGRHNPVDQNKSATPDKDKDTHTHTYSTLSYWPTLQAIGARSGECDGTADPSWQCSVAQRKQAATSTRRDVNWIEPGALETYKTHVWEWFRSAGFLFLFFPLRLHKDEILRSGLESCDIFGSVHLQLCKVIIWKKKKRKNMKCVSLRQVHRHVFPISRNYTHPCCQAFLSFPCTLKTLLNIHRLSRALREASPRGKRWHMQYTQVSRKNMYSQIKRGAWLRQKKKKKGKKKG